MPNRYFPTVKNIVYATLAAIHQHRYIREPIVNHPIVNADGSYDKVPIVRYRTYDGIELIEPGLTLAMFPAYSNKSSYDTQRTKPPSVSFEPYHLGPKDNKYLFQAAYKFIIALYYQEVAINESRKVYYYRDSIGRIEEGNSVGLKERDGKFIRENSFELEVNPGEDILRDYLDVIRLVLEEVTAKGLLPWKIRGTYVSGFDYPSSSWLRESNDVYFHTAYLTWDVSLFAPAILEPDITPATIEVLNFFFPQELLV